MLLPREEIDLPDIKKYISVVTSGEYSKPNNVSYEVVRNSCISDALLCAKLKFFNSVAKQVSPFLTVSLKVIENAFFVYWKTLEFGLCKS